MTVTTIDPATGDLLASYEETSPDELDAILERAHTAAGSWRLTPPAQRAEALGRLASTRRAERLTLVDGRTVGIRPLEYELALT